MKNNSRKIIRAPLQKEAIESLRAGDMILLSGLIYTARDAAHAKLNESIKHGDELPFELSNQIIYYTGPSPEKPGQTIGACGPTTSYRMDDLTIPLLKRGIKGMIGKGERQPKIIDAICQYGAVYFAAIGGAGALIADSVVENQIIAYPELGTEAIRRLVIKDLPLTVVIDCKGGDLYTSERIKYKR